VTLIVRAARAGGLSPPARAEHGLAEAAAHSLPATPAVRELARDLGVELVPVQDPARHIFRDGRMRSHPVGVGALARAAIRAYFALAERGSDPGRLDLEPWGKRHLGSELVEYALNPFLRGIYAARPRELAVGAAFPQLVVPPGHSLVSSWFARRVTRRLPSAPRARGRMMSPRDGMQALTDALALRLQERLGARFRLGESVTSLPESPNLVLGVPAPVSASLLRDAAPETAEALAQIRYAPLLSVTAIVPRANVPARARGVGVLVPEREPGPECLGILFNSSAFDGRVSDAGRWASFTLIFGGTSRPEAVAWEDARVREKSVGELQRVLGVEGEPAELRVHRWPEAIPIHSAELLDAWDAAGRGWCARPGRILAGNWTGQVSVRGMIESSLALEGDES
jgi:oxygen-dependent protoporphyrinogen oxidase